MRIVNIMSSKVLGGVEQAFLNYNKALSITNNKVFAFYNRFGQIKNKITPEDNVEYFSSFFLRPCCLMLPYYLIKIKRLKVDLIIVHSKKMLPLFSDVGIILKIPVVIVSHNEKMKLIDRADYIFSITKHQKDIFVKNGFDKDKIFVIPNLISFKKEFKEFNKSSDTIIFGIIGRFDPMKGFSVFIKACKILKDKGIKFKAKIAGTPQKQYMDEYNKIINLINESDLNNDIELLGWINNKDEFYDKIDVFVMPFNYEPFGIVLLEAMMYSKPIISSFAEGPKEILSNSKSALMFEANDVVQLASLMKEIIINTNLARELSKNGYDLVNKKYTLENISNILYKAIQNIMYSKE